MTTIDTTQGQRSGASGDFVILPSDVYRMKISKAVLTENPYGEPNTDGKKPLQIAVTWEVTSLTDEQADAAAEAEEAWVGATVPQYLNPYYGPVRAGGVSKFQAWIDALRAQGYLEDFNPRAVDVGAFVGIEQRVTVEQYTKSQGENAGKPGNKITAVLPLRNARARREAQRAEANGKPAAKPGVVEEAEIPNF